MRDSWGRRLTGSGVECAWQLELSRWTPLSTWAAEKVIEAGEFVIGPGVALRPLRVLC